MTKTLFRAVRPALIAVLITIYTLPLMLFQELALRTGWWSDRIAPRLWHRITLRLLGIRVHVSGQVADGRPLMIAANHVSWTDIPVLGSLAGIHFIAKSEVRHWPVFGTFARLQRSVFIERERRYSTSSQAREIAARLSNGDPMVLFAEGTTGDGNRVQPFKTSLFGAANLALKALEVESMVVQPVCIAYMRRGGLPLNRSERAEIAWLGDIALIPHLLRLIKAGPHDVEVLFGTPISFDAGSDRKKIAQAAEKAVRDMLTSALRGRSEEEPSAQRQKASVF